MEIFMESAYTGAEIVGFVATYTVGVAYILTNLILAGALVRYLFKGHKKRKDIQKTEDTEK